MRPIEAAFLAGTKQLLVTIPLAHGTGYSYMHKNASSDHSLHPFCSPKEQPVPWAKPELLDVIASVLGTGCFHTHSIAAGFISSVCRSSLSHRLMINCWPRFWQFSFWPAGQAALVGCRREGGHDHIFCACRSSLSRKMTTNCWPQFLCPSTRGDLLLCLLSLLGSADPARICLTWQLGFEIFALGSNQG